MNLEPAVLSNILLILTAWGGAFLAALWLSLVIWTYRDIRNRARDILARILAVLVVAVLFLPGIVIYLILRPGAHWKKSISTPWKRKHCSRLSKILALSRLRATCERELGCLPQLPYQA